MPGKILLIDDDVTLARNVRRVLEKAGYATAVAFTAEDGLDAAFQEHPDLVLLDIMVPTSGGWAVCRQLRQVSQVPIIFLTALGNTENVVHGLELGADDYIVKPFDEAELLARVRAHLRRSQVTGLPAARLSFGDNELTIDMLARRIQVRGAEVELTPREYELLVTLASNAGRVLPANELVRRAWSMTDASAAENLKPYIHYLRKKIEVDSADPRWILTVRGVGYRFADIP